MARPSRWNTPTVAIRVPSHCADRLLELAKTLDSEFCTKPDPEESVLITVGNSSQVVTAPKSVWDEADRLVDEFMPTVQALTKSQRSALLIGLAEAVGLKSA